MCGRIARATGMLYEVGVVWLTVAGVGGSKLGGFHATRQGDMLVGSGSKCKKAKQFDPLRPHDERGWRMQA